MHALRMLCQEASGSSYTAGVCWLCLCLRVCVCLYLCLCLCLCLCRRAVCRWNQPQCHLWKDPTVGDCRSIRVYNTYPSLQSESIATFGRIRPSGSVAQWVRLPPVPL